MQELYENPSIETILERFISYKYKNDNNGKFFDKYESLSKIFITKLNQLSVEELESKSYIYQRGEIDDNTKKLFIQAKQLNKPISKCFGYNVLFRLLEKVGKIMLQDHEIPHVLSNLLSVFRDDLEQELTNKNSLILAPININEQSNLISSQFSSYNKEKMIKIEHENVNNNQLNSKKTNTFSNTYFTQTNIEYDKNINEDGIYSGNNVSSFEINSNDTNNNFNNDTDSNSTSFYTSTEKMETDFQFTTNGDMISRDASAQTEEVKGIIEFEIVWNDGSDYSLKRLINLKSLFSAQLPKMPKEYIVRLVFDRNHRSVCILKKTALSNSSEKDLTKNNSTNCGKSNSLQRGSERKLIGGICFRPFYKTGFAEIVFCAITNNEQIKGYGTRLMNHAKEHLKAENIEYILAYADNNAIGYFKKQGFVKTLSMPSERWKGYIKHYDSSTLMECRLYTEINYLHIPEMLKIQKRCLDEEIRKFSNSHVLRPGLSYFKNNNDKPMNILDIPGIQESGYKPSDSEYRHFMRKSPVRDMQARFGAIIKNIKNMSDSWPFHKPVDKKITSYYAIIKQPMDLQKISSNLNCFKYSTKEEFTSDFMLIVNNCKTFNSESTSYYRCALAIEKEFNSLLKE